MDFERFLDLIRAMNFRGVRYVLVGGMAMGAHGLVRATEDIDLFVDPAEDNIQRCKDALRSVWDDTDIDQVSAADLSGDYPTVRYGPPGETFVIDLISSLGSAFQYADIEFETVKLEDVIVRVATPRMLYRMKKGTLRPIDQADAAALRARFDLEEE